MRLPTIWLCLAASGLSGCATLEIDNDAGKSGAPFHDVRPYLIVSQAGDCSRTASVMTLPDMTTTYFVRPRPGLGTNTLSASFANGTLTTFNQETNVDPTGLITTVAGLLGVGPDEADRGGQKDTESTKPDKGDGGHDCPVATWIFVVGPGGALTLATPPIK